MPISASPFCTSTGFWVPPPGMTLTVSCAFSRSSSAMPPEIAYQPPPTAPAVHVRLDWAVVGPASSTATAIVTSVIVARLIGDLPGSLGALQYLWTRTCRQAALVTPRRGRGSSRDRRHVRTPLGRTARERGRGCLPPATPRRGGPSPATAWSPGP